MDAFEQGFDWPSAVKTTAKRARLEPGLERLHARHLEEGANAWTKLVFSQKFHAKSSRENSDSGPPQRLDSLSI